MRKLALSTLLALVFILIGGSKALALSKSEWQAGRIIDDLVFFDDTRMGTSTIQKFLNAKVPECDTNGTKEYGDTGMTRAEWAEANGKPLPPYICLKNF